MMCNPKIYLTVECINKCRDVGLELEEVTVSWLHHYLMAQRIDVIPTMSEFSRTYGYKIYYVEGGKTLVHNAKYTKYPFYADAMHAGLMTALDYYKAQNDGRNT